MKSLALVHNLQHNLRIVINSMVRKKCAAQPSAYEQPSSGCNHLAKAMVLKQIDCTTEHPNWCKYLESIRRRNFVVLCYVLYKAIM